MHVRLSLAREAWKQRHCVVTPSYRHRSWQPPLSRLQGLCPATVETEEALKTTTSLITSSSVCVSAETVIGAVVAEEVVGNEPNVEVESPRRMRFRGREGEEGVDGDGRLTNMTMLLWSTALTRLDYSYQGCHIRLVTLVTRLE